MIINKELLLLKDEFLKEIRDLETKLDSKLEKQSIILGCQNQEQEDKINLTIQKNEKLYENMLEQKNKLEKISELSVSQKKLNDMLISHEMRINTLLTENKKLFLNYDKIIADNLIVPGYIGSSCPYKNLSEYLQYNINEIQKIKNEKESDKKITEDIKNKLDYFMKNMLTLVDNSVTRCNQYADNKQVYLENILNNKLVEFNEKNMNLRTQIFTNFSKTNRQVEEFGIKLDELKNIKEDIDNEMKIKFKEIINIFEESKKIFNQNLEDIKKYKNSLNDIVENKFDDLMKKIKNNKTDLKFKKYEETASPNIKSFRAANKREDIINTFSIKSSKNIINSKNENNFRKRFNKRFTIVNPKESSKKFILEAKEEKEENNKTSIDIDKSDKSDDDSTNKVDDNNIIINTNLFKEENKEKEIKEIKEDRNDKNDKNIKDLKINNNINNEYILKQIENKKNINPINTENSENITNNSNIKITNNTNPNNSNTNPHYINTNPTITSPNNSNPNNSNPNNSNLNINNKNISNKNNNSNNYNIEEKSLNSYYANNIKTLNNQKKKINEINDKNTITIEENRIKIPRILESYKYDEKDKDKFSIDFNSNKNTLIKYSLNKNNNKNNIETRNNIIKSTNNTFNYIQLSKEKEKIKREKKEKEKEKEREFKSINSDNSFLENKELYNTSPKFSSIETQTPKIVIKNKTKSKFPKIGFSYKIINLGSDINFKERNMQNIQNIQQINENSKTSIDLSKPLTNTYKAYQKKKNEKKNNSIKNSLTELQTKGIFIKKNFILPRFNNSFYKKNNNEYEYINLKKNKNTEIEHSIESVKSSTVKIIKENHLK